MATTNRDKGNLETGRLAVDGGAVNDGMGEVSGTVAERSRVVDSGGLFYTLAGATVVTFLGALALLWGDSQDNVLAQAVGMCLLLVGCVAWVAGFGVMTWWMVLDTGPLLWRWLKRTRKGLPKQAGDGIED